MRQPSGPLPHLPDGTQRPCEPQLPEDRRAVLPPDPDPLLPRPALEDGSLQSHWRVAEWLAQPEERPVARHSFCDRTERPRLRRRGISEPRNVPMTSPSTGTGNERMSPIPYRRSTRSTVLPPLSKKMSFGQQRKKP